MNCRIGMRGRTLPMVGAVLVALTLGNGGAASATQAGVIATLSVGTAPWGVAFSPDGSRAYVGNSGSDTVSVINVEARTVVASVSTGAGTNPSGIVVTPDGTKVLATLPGADEMAAVTTSTLTVTTASAGCTDPLPVTMRNDGAAAYVGCVTGAIRQISTSNLASTPIAFWTAPIRDIALVPTDRDIAFTLSAFLSENFQLVSGNLVDTLASQGMSIAVNTAGTLAYVGQANGTLSVFRVSAPFGLDHTISVGGQLSGIALTPDGTQAYVVDKANNVVKVVDLASRQVVQTLAVGNSPQRIAISPSGRMALVTNNGSNTVSLIDLQASGGDQPGEANEARPISYTLQLDAGSGGTCPQTSISGLARAWVTLPTAADCAPASGNRPLLGWATSAGFPVDIAKRQVDRGWGAYELADSDGRPTAVFIPAGGATRLTGANTLHAIWSK